MHLFIDFLTNKEFEPVTHQEDETYTVVIPEKMNDDLYDKIEEKYEVLFAMNEDLDESGPYMASITLTLNDGRLSYADVDPKVLGRIIGVVSSDEFAELVKTIVNTVKNSQPQFILLFVANLRNRPLLRSVRTLIWKNWNLNLNI